MKHRTVALRAPLLNVAAIVALSAGFEAQCGAQSIIDTQHRTVPAPLDKPSSPSPFAAAPSQADSIAPSSPDGSPIETVTVRGDNEGSTAIPPRGWQPPTDKSGVLALAYSPGQSLDAPWVRAQFANALAAGPLPPSRAIALVQLINRAFIGAGFINSGLLVEGREGPQGHDLGIRLVLGRLTASEKASPVTVDFVGGRKGGLGSNFVATRFPSARGQPLSAVDLEHDFRLLSEDPAIETISASLVPGARPGEAGLRLLVTPARRVDVYIGYANDRSPSVGGERLSAGGYVRNILSSGDLLSGEYGTTKGIKDGQFAYSTPFFWPSFAFDIGASFNRAAVVTSALIPLDIRARDRSFQAGFTTKIIAEPLMVRGSEKRWSASQSLTAGMHFLRRKQESYLLGQPFSFAPGSVDGRSNFDAIRLSADYLRRNQRQVIAASVAATFGLDGTRSNVPGIPNPERDFAAYTAQLNFAHRLGDSFELRGRATGQWSNGALYSGLRLAVGGSNSVRGYRETLFLVDRGVIGSLELARYFNLGLGKKPGKGRGDLSVFAFVDGARFANATAPQPSVKSIASVGAGLDWNPSPAFGAGVTYGYALRTIPIPGDKSLQDRGIQFRFVVHPLQFF